MKLKQFKKIAYMRLCWLRLYCCIIYILLNACLYRQHQVELSCILIERFNPFVLLLPINAIFRIFHKTVLVDFA